MLDRFSESIARKEKKDPRWPNLEVKSALSEAHRLPHKEGWAHTWRQRNGVLGDK